MAVSRLRRQVAAVSPYDLPDPSDIPGTTAFAEAQEDMQRDDEIDDACFLVEHPAVKLACLAKNIAGGYRAVVGTERGVMLDGATPLIAPILLALKLDRQTRQQVTESLEQRGATVAVVEHDDGGVVIHDVIDKDETGVPPDPARWCFEKLSEVYWGDAS